VRVLADDTLRLLETGYLEMLRRPQPGRHYVVVALSSAGITIFIAGLNQKKEQALNVIDQRAIRRFLAKPHSDFIEGTNGIHELRTRGGIRFYYFFDGAALVVITHGREHVNKRRVLAEGRRAEGLREEYLLRKEAVRKGKQ
jgi:hypothetical protein